MAHDVNAETQSKADSLRIAARRALAAHDELVKAWRAMKDAGSHSLGTEEDVALLKDLILRRIYPVNAFSALAVTSKGAALEVLFDRYLGSGVDPDTKFGGYTFELECMLYRLKEANGDSVLREILVDRRFKQSLLQDRRVVFCFSDALDINEEELIHWIEDK